MLWPGEKFGSFFAGSGRSAIWLSHSIKCPVLTVQAAPDGFQLRFLLELHKQVLVDENSRTGV